jgi:phosphopantetheinyl transferase
VTPSLYLRRFAMPLNDAWQAEQIVRLTCSERARVARISRPQRRAQFVVAHYMLREALVSGGLHDARIEVDAEGRLQVLQANATVHASIAHSKDWVAVIVAGDPVGVDLESIPHRRDLAAAAAMLDLTSAEAATPNAVLRAWVTAEARLKAGQNATPQVWLSVWESCQLAVAGVSSPPLTGVFDGMTGIYNAAKFQWDAV